MILCTPVMNVSSVEGTLLGAKVFCMELFLPGVKVPRSEKPEAQRKLNIPYRIIWLSNHFFCSAQLLNTDLNGGCDQQLSDDHQKFMTLTGKLS